MDRAAKEAQLISGIDTEPNNLHHCLSESIYVCRSSSFCDSLLLNQSGSNPIFQWKKYKDRCREICVRISFKNRLTFCAARRLFIVVAITLEKCKFYLQIKRKPEAGF
jgi:hypothetical protein